MASRIRTAVTVLSFLVMGVVSTPAYAGCGCEKPAPAVAPVRPHATYAGTDVTLFHPGLQVGVTYAVT